MGWIVKWGTNKAYVGTTGKVEGVDGDLWPMGKAMWMLKRMLKHRKIEYTEEECVLCLTGVSQLPKKEDPPKEESDGECVK